METCEARAMLTPFFVREGASSYRVEPCLETTLRSIRTKDVVVRHDATANRMATFRSSPDGILAGHHHSCPYTSQKTSATRIGYIEEHASNCYVQKEPQLAIGHFF